MVGQEVTIYGDSLINVPIGNPLIVTYTCDIGTQVGNNFVISPVEGDIGDHSLRAVFTNGSYTIEDKSITISVRAAFEFADKKILLIGDSTLANGITYIVNALNAALTGCSLTYLGTVGDAIKHEGHGGWSFNSFITTGSPFYKSGTLDIAAYFTDNSIDDPDIVSIRLGINDVFASSAVAGDGLTDAEMTAIINNAKTLIDGFLTYNATLKIIISLPTTTENTNESWSIGYDPAVYSQNMFLDAIHKFQKGLVDTFANGVYNARVDCGYEAISLDRDNGYPETNGIHTNAIHPDAGGYAQIGAAMALKINDIYNAFQITIDTTKAGSAADTFVLPTAGGGYVYAYHVDWGDNTEEYVTANTSQTHVYSVGGTYKVRIRGTFPRIVFANTGDRLKLITIDHWGKIHWASLGEAFFGCSNMQGAWDDIPDLSAVGTMMLYRTFRGCAAFNYSFSGWDTSEVITMKDMMNGASIFNQDMSHFVTSKVTTMYTMLYNCTAFKQSLASFNLDAITEMDAMLTGVDLNTVGTTANYDNTLIAWAADENTPTGITFGGGNSKYSDVGQVARDFLTLAIGSGGKGWAITDGGHI